MAFNYFSSGTGSQNFPKPQVARPKARPPVYNKSYSAAARNATAQRQNVGHYGTRSGGRSSYSNYTPARSSRPSYGSSRQTYASTYSPSRSGKSVGSNNTGRIGKTAPAPPAKPIPKPLTTDEWLAQGGDTVYKQQRDLLAAAQKDYNTRGQKEGLDYGITNAANRKQLESEQGRSRQDLINDYTARGMLGGAQQTALTDFDTDWTKRLGDFDTAYANWGTDQAQAAEDYKKSNTAQLTKAQQDAIARRAASMA